VRKIQATRNLFHQVTGRKETMKPKMDWGVAIAKKDKKQEGVNEDNRAVVEVTHV
jgi:hypothetical protein